ncbi:protein yellow-like [Mya arenaria]|uniref:protein yellow-like n=1 Tax=Mya arenaria TaxID=6604 RepID=UPI0022E1B875|nr:protein yellow-like [Mya arenaria]
MQVFVNTCRACLLLACISFQLTTVSSQSRDNISYAWAIYELPNVQYDWPNTSEKARAIRNGEYIVENNIITGIKVHMDTIYVTVPRWRPGVPSTLNVLGEDGVLRPFPSWAMNTLGDCGSLQYVQSMEVDPNTGRMWIIDTGRVDTRAAGLSPRNLCPPKLVILDITTKKIERVYEFPDNVVSHTSNFMNDIVLDYVDGEARFAYISDTSDAKIYVYDFERNASYYYQDITMNAQRLIPGVQDGLLSAPVDGIAMSADFAYVYYCTLTSIELYAIPTHTLRRPGANFSADIIHVGQKAGGSDGMVCGQTSLFYAVFERNAVFKAHSELRGQSISLKTQNEVISDQESVKWVDTFAFNGTDLWFVANKLNLFATNQLNFNGSQSNMYIWRLEVGEHGYLWRARERTLNQNVPLVIVG